jgi:predicted unusual protein kinase regulating ubiquinone biosynthesis (AarF/ABC1/UbiB family)
MLLPDAKMGVIDFGAVAPLPGGIPIEIGLSTRYALNDDYDNLLATMQKIGFVQKGEQVSKREMDEMMKQYVEPLEVEVFHYTRKWLQRITAMSMKPDRAAGQIRAARQMDVPAKLAIPLRVIASNVAIACQLDAHVPVRALATELIPGFADEAA